MRFKGLGTTKVLSREEVEGRYSEALSRIKMQKRKLTETLSSAESQLGLENARIQAIHKKIEVLNEERTRAFSFKQQRIRELRVQERISNETIFLDPEVIDYGDSYNKLTLDLVEQQGLLNEAKERESVLSKKTDETFQLLEELSKKLEGLGDQRIRDLINADHLRTLISLDCPFGSQKKEFKLTTSMQVFLIWLAVYLCSVAILMFFTQLEISIRIALILGISAIAGGLTALVFLMKE